MADSDLTKSLLSKSCNDLYDNDKNSNYKIHNESNFTRFHHYPYSGSSSFHSNFYGLIPSIPNDDETPTSNSCINIITKGAYDDGLDTPLIIKNELHIKIENDNSEDDETSTVSPTDSEIAETKHDMYISESKILVKYSIPIIISEILRNTLLIMPLIFIGHRSSYELAAIALGI